MSGLVWRQPHSFPHSMVAERHQVKEVKSLQSPVVMCQSYHLSSETLGKDIISMSDSLQEQCSSALRLLSRTLWPPLWRTWLTGKEKLPWPHIHCCTND